MKKAWKEEKRRELYASNDLGIMNSKKWYFLLPVMGSTRKNYFYFKIVTIGIKNISKTILILNARASHNGSPSLHHQDQFVSQNRVYLDFLGTHENHSFSHDI